MRVSATFVEVDNVCDYVPVVSTLSNLVDLFWKCVCQCLSSETVEDNRYWKHIQLKDIFRCILLLIPVVGNLYIFLSDHSEYQEDKTRCEKMIQHRKEGEKWLARQQARLAEQASGHAVTPAEMMPAQEEKQLNLFAACANSEVSSLRQLLSEGVSPNFYHSGLTPLVTACQCGSQEMVELLVAQGAEVHTCSRFGTSPFEEACTRGELGIIRALRPHIADINAPNAKGVPPLMLAAVSGKRDAVEFLIREGADRRAVMPDSTDALSIAIFKDHDSLLPSLTEESENLDDRKYWIRPDLFSSKIAQLTPLLYATLVGAEKSALYLILKSDVTRVDSGNNNALYYASSHLPVMQALLARCSTPEFVNHQNCVQATALHHALQLDHPDTALLLLDHGADPFLADNDDETPFTIACQKGYAGVIQKMRELHSDRITAEMEQMIAASPKAPAEKQPPKSDPLISSLNFLQQGLEWQKQDLERQEKRKRSSGD